MARRDRMTRRWPADGPQMARRDRMARRWSIHIFENAFIGSCASKLFTKFFSLLFLRKEFLLKNFFMILFISFYPPKNVTVWEHFDDVAKWAGSVIFTLLTHDVETSSVV